MPEQPAATGAELIAAERQRQLDAEGWDTWHDDGHDAGELAMAAACYATPPDERDTRPVYTDDAPSSTVPLAWPWDTYDWKPTPDDRKRELVKAGALIAAEIDRLQRAER